VTEPTLAEVVRRFEDATKRLSGEMAELTREMREERRTNEQTYLRKDVYEANRHATIRDIADVRGDVEELKKASESDRGWRRQASLTLAIAAGGWLVSIAVAVFALLTRG
jgi:hypothetical protein